jgi:hypothetical protein
MLFLFRGAQDGIGYIGHNHRLARSTIAGNSASLLIANSRIRISLAASM